MRRIHWITRTAVGLALLGTLFPAQPALAQEPGQRPAAIESTPMSAAPAQASPTQTSPAMDITDIALNAGGVFSGQVVDAQGRLQAGTSVLVCRQQQVVATAATDQQGQFAIRGLQGGVYQVVAGQSMKNYRLWAPETAPPAARQSALLVSSSQVVRGQGGLRYWITNPWVLAVGVAAAIAVPIALSNRGKPNTS